MRTYLFLGLYARREVEAGWTVGDAVDFVWLSQALIMPVFLWGWWEIALTIRSGDVVSDLSKPFDYYTFWLSQDAGRAVFHLIFRSAPTLLVGVLLFDVGLPGDAGRWLAFLLSVTLAVWISFGLRFLVNISAFWLLDYRGLGVLVMFATSFFSGLLVPLAFVSYFPSLYLLDRPEGRDLPGWIPFLSPLAALLMALVARLARGFGVRHYRSTGS